MKIIFFGSDPWFSPPVLKALKKAGYEILLAINKENFKTAEDISRKKLNNLTRRHLPTEGVSLTAPTEGVSLTAPTEGVSLTAPDAIVLAAFGPPFLSSELLTWPKYGALNVHASLLPRWRGASPVYAAIKNGDKETGVSVMKMTKEVDRGPILGQRKIEIAADDNRKTLTEKLGLLGGKLIVETINLLYNEQIILRTQPVQSPTSYTRRITKEEGRINWNQSPIEIERFIRAVSPWPGAIASLKFKVKSAKWQTIKDMKILKAHVEHPGKLIIDVVQLPGKNPISWKQFLAGHPKAKLI